MRPSRQAAGRASRGSSASAPTQGTKSTAAQEQGSRPTRADGDRFVEPCIPTLATEPPSGSGWVHEIKHDGYRLIVWRDGHAVRLFTRRGYDWTERYPAIASAAAKPRAKSFTIDGEAAVVGADGIAMFEALHRRHKATDAMLYGFEVMDFTVSGLRSM
jgi:bifunctional non-homologous end joining protein LigD